jgi:hypothetical protein
LQSPYSLPSSQSQRHLPTQVLCAFIVSFVLVICPPISHTRTFHSPNNIMTRWLFPSKQIFFQHSVSEYLHLYSSPTVKDNFTCTCAQSILQFWKPTDLQHFSNFIMNTFSVHYSFS